MARSDHDAGFFGREVHRPVLARVRFWLRTIGVLIGLATAAVPLLVLANLTNGPVEISSWPGDCGDRGPYAPGPIPRCIPYHGLAQIVFPLSAAGVALAAAVTWGSKLRRLAAVFLATMWVPSTLILLVVRWPADYDGLVVDIVTFASLSILASAAFLIGLRLDPPGTDCSSPAS